MKSGLGEGGSDHSRHFYGSHVSGRRGTLAAGMQPRFLFESLVLRVGLCYLLAAGARGDDGDAKGIA